MPALENDTKEIIETFANNLKQRNFGGSRDLALSTVQLLKKVIGQSKWQNARELMEIIKSVGKDLMGKVPSETVVGNMTRRVLKIIRDEYATLQKTGTHSQSEPDSAEHPESLQKILLADEVDCDYAKSMPTLITPIMEHIGEFIEELESSEGAIAAQALEHIHANEIIMTIGYSKTVLAFLKVAAKSRKFEVIVAECAPFLYGHKLAVELGEAGISNTLITDPEIFAMMARVNKVFIGTHSIMADGGLKAIIGSYTVALSAKHYSVPVVVCAHLFKHCPEFVHSLDQDGFNEFGSPNDVLSYDEGQLVSHTQTYNPIFDYVPPDLVTLIVSNTGGHSPSYTYRFLSELYHPLDLEL